VRFRTCVCALAAAALLAAPHAARCDQVVPDLTQDYIRTPNFPRSDDLPTERVPKLPDGLALEPGAMSKAAITFTPGGTTDTRAKLDAQMYYNSIFGDQNRVTGDDGIEGDTASNFTRPRRYEPSNPFNLLNFTPSGLDLSTVCSLNNTPAGCTRGHVYGAMIRIPTVILPGDIVSITMQTGNSPLFYTGPAMYAGVQTTPWPGGRPYELRGSLHYAGCYGEIDGSDNYAEPNVAVGHQLKMGAVPNGSYAENVAGKCYRRAPHEVYDANGRHFIYHPNHEYPFFEIIGTPTYAGMHTYTWWITDDGSSLIYYFFDGMLVRIQYYEAALPFYTDASGTRRRLGYSLVIASQTIPVFLNPDHDIRTGVYAHIVPNDGGPIVGGPWSATIQAIKIIHGSISANALAAATVDPNGTDHANYGGLRDYDGR
jgi:hypothetical protein